VLQRRTLTRNVDCPRVDEDSEDLIDRKRERSLSFEALERLPFFLNR